MQRAPAGGLVRRRRKIAGAYCGACFVALLLAYVLLVRASFGDEDVATGNAAELAKPPPVAAGVLPLSNRNSRNVAASDAASSTLLVAGRETTTDSECRPDSEKRPGQGCGRRCEEHGLGVCCKDVLVSASEAPFYDDVPWELSFDESHVPGPITPARHSKDPIRTSSNPSLPLQLHGCRAAGGEGLRIPLWLPPLWRELTTAFDLPSLSSRLSRPDTGGGSVLVVWIPSKFMPPQKPGKNVRGELVEAATKGSNNSYYLEQYQALWATSYTSGDMAYHAQVVSRDALVVCFWERLHINQYNCAAKPDGPRVAIHFCQCRHCADKFSSTVPVEKNAANPPTPPQAPLARYAARRPPDASVFVTVSDPESKRQLQCIDAGTAPWLVRRKHKPAFKYEGLHNDLKRLLEVQADENRVVLVYIFNKFWVDHLHNVVFSMTKHAGFSNFIVATLDCESLELCMKNRLPCLNAERFAEAESDMKVGGAGHKKGFQRKVTEELSWIKPRLALKVMSLGFRFLMADMDMSWWTNPMDNVITRQADFVHQCDTPNKQSINTGFYLLHDNAHTKALFQNILVFPPWRLSDQNALKLAVRYDHTHDASSICLDRWKFNMKCNYKVDKSEKSVNGVRTFKWKPQQRRRDLFDWHIFHATCLDGAVAKIDWLRASNAWFLDDLDAATHQPYCLVTDDLILTNETRTTMHSAKYPTKLDESYLQERH
ncbi:Beta-arabinofuranosyltransferase RAY1 [Diplonema papillatum]|nr:Beta-arabinofuranosyltransferase RAY1 [Diplonema papillatum]